MHRLGAFHLDLCLLSLPTGCGAFPPRIGFLIFDFFCHFLSPSLSLLHGVFECLGLLFVLVNHLMCMFVFPSTMDSLSGLNPIGAALPV